MGGQVYYPQCWVRIRVRFEDYLGVPSIPQPQIPGDMINSDGAVDIGGRIIPTYCSVSLRSYREANECRITIPYGRVPFDPRTIRMASVQVFMGSLDPGEFSDAIGPISGESTINLIPETPDLQLEGEDITNEVFRGFIDDWKISQDGDDLVEMSCRDITGILLNAEMPIQGLAGIPKDITLDKVIEALLVGDEIAQGVPPDNRELRSRRLESRRDIRRLSPRLSYVNSKIAKVAAALSDDPSAAAELARLLQKQSALTIAIATAASIAEAGDAVPVIAQRYGLESMRGILVINNTGVTLPTLGALKGPTFFDSNGTAKKARTGGSKEQIKYWDFIVDLCVSAGFICYIRTPVQAQSGLPRTELVIDLPKTYYPEEGLELREFQYGLNVDSLAIQRNYQGENIVDGVVVSAIEAKTGQVITARFPEISKVNQPGTNVAGVGGDRTEYKTIITQDRIPGDNAQEILLTQAQSLYEQFGRGEMMVDIETTSMAALPSNLELSQAEDGASPVDMLQLRPGDPVKIAIVPTAPSSVGGDIPQFTTAGNIWGRTVAERVPIFADLLAGGDPNLAAILTPAATGLAEAMDNAFLQVVFRVRDFNIDFDYMTGFKFSINAINYLDARNAVTRQENAGINAARAQLTPAVTV